MARTYKFEPVLFDRMSGGHLPEPGTLVIKTQPFGCPRNGTMGMTYVADAETGKFYGMACLNSLVPVKKARVSKAQSLVDFGLASDLGDARAQLRDMGESGCV